MWLRMLLLVSSSLKFSRDALWTSLFTVNVYLASPVTALWSTELPWTDCGRFAPGCWSSFVFLTHWIMLGFTSIRQLLMSLCSAGSGSLCTVAKPKYGGGNKQAQVSSRSVKRGGGAGGKCLIKLAHTSVTYNSSWMRTTTWLPKPWIVCEPFSKMM